MTIEIKKATAHLKPSAFDESAQGNITGHISRATGINPDQEKLKELHEQMKTRASKDDSEMCLR